MNAKRRQGVEVQLDKAAQACILRGAQLTELRRQVLSLILEAEGPLTAYRLLDRLRERRKGAVPPTVYRALDFLLGQRLIHKVERLNAFVPCTESGRQHPAQFLICRQCGTVAEIEDRDAAQALENAAERQGFHPRNTVVEIEGTCAACFEQA
ncbi:MAG TPA: Fur family transcriptional regulator [Stellaceae bacterium]|nr:Fur family transcriptional regulator [Stellaceae bacterium]